MPSPTGFDSQLLIDIARRHGLAYLALFGSHARGEATADSDVDLYARFGRPVGLMEVLAVQHEMEDSLGVAVDLIVEEAVIPYDFVRAGMQRDQVVLYSTESTDCWKKLPLDAYRPAGMSSPSYSQRVTTP